MESREYKQYLDVLMLELVPALGCTEPIAIAFAVAKAVEILGEFPASLTLFCSGNIIKNAKAVTVPNSDGMKGIAAAAVLGAIGGEASKKLEVLSGITSEHIKKARELLVTDFVTVRLEKNVSNLYICVQAKSAEHECRVTVANHHTEIVSIVRDGEILLDEYRNGDCSESKFDMSINGILQFAEKAELEDIKPVIARQLEANMRISDFGLNNEIGAKVGKTLMKKAGSSVKERAKARAAAGSDARMSGCALPVVINSGSGNQGITVTMPVFEYAMQLNSGEERLYRALVISNLIAIYIKRQIGSLSSFCGAVTAGCGAGAAITYLRNGSRERICDTITNMLMDVSGIICDGAKPSCAAKIASAVEAAVLASDMSMNGIVYCSGEGLVQDSVEATIRAVACVAREGMNATDIHILRIMTGETAV